MQLVHIHPKDIDIDGEWLLWPEAPDKALADSLAALGQTTPVLADFSRNRPRLVAGYRRTLALRNVRGAVLTALAVDDAAWTHGRPADALGETSDETSPETRFGLLYLASNMGRAVSEAMQVRALRFFTKHAPVSAALETAGPYLGLAPKSRPAGRLEQWAAFPAAFDALLESGNLTLASAPDLARLGPDGREALTPCFRTLRWSRNNLRNLAAWLTETAVRNETTVPGVVRDIGLAEILDKGLSPNDALAAILSAARIARYPHLSGLEARFTELAKALSKGTPFKASPSPGFESDAVTLTVRVGGSDELNAAARGLETMRGRSEWDGLWTLARDGEE